MKKILIIDDDEAVLKMMERLLGRAGYEVVPESNGEKAVQVFREERFDLIITDIIMPKKEGIEIVTMLKRDMPDVKVIAMSGGGRFSPEGYLKSAEVLGAHKTFVKPFDHREMINAVKELIGE